MTVTSSATAPDDDGPGIMTCYVDNAFPRASIDFLNRLAEASAGETETASVVRPNATGHALEEVRRSEVFWLKDTPETRPIQQLVTEFVKQANSQVFGYELAQFEPFQLATYRAENAGFYNWHVDLGAGASANRKLSLIVPLTDPSEYEGGQFQSFFDSEPETIPMPLGRVLAFPSYMLHRVTPVTRGIRRSLAVWVCGRPFR